MEEKTIVITGIGVSTSISDNYEELVECIKNNTYNRHSRGNDILDAVAEKFGRNACRRMDNFTLYSLMSAYNAIENSKLDLDNEDKTRIGTIYSTIWGPAYTTNNYFEPVIKAGAKGVSPLLFPYTVTNAALGAVARMTGLSGVSTMLVESSAIEFSCGQIKDGKADVIVCGATEFLTPLIKEFGFDNELNVPFDGAVSLVLETKEHAMNRDTHIYAEISCNSSIYSQSLQHESMFSCDLLSFEQIVSVIYYIVYGMDPEESLVSRIGEKCFNTIKMVKKYEK